jgi:hypothetical protein
MVRLFIHCGTGSSWIALRSIRATGLLRGWARPGLRRRERDIGSTGLTLHRFHLQAPEQKARMNFPVPDGEGGQCHIVASSQQWSRFAIISCSLGWIAPANAL